MSVDLPIRTCVGCRARAAKVDLLRIAWQGGLVVDERQTAPGRGAYLHRDLECLEQAIRRRSVGRALRAPTIDPVVLADAVTPHLGRPLAAEQPTSRNRVSVT